MRFLSEVISTAYCPASAPSTPDRFFSVGCRLVGAGWTPDDAGDASAIATQAASLAGSPRLPWEPDTEIEGVFNDLFSPFREEADGRLYVWAPVPIEEPLSSSVLARDWRAVALAWWAARRVGAPDDMVVVFSAFDAVGRVVSFDARAEEIYGAMDVALAIQKTPHERPGGACFFCSRAALCRSFSAIVEDLGPKVPPGKDDTTGIRGLRLYSERAAISQKMEVLERRREVVDKELTSLMRDGRIKLGPDELLEVPSRITASWDYRDVKNVLDAFGLWQDSLASIKVGELRRLMEKMPKGAVDKLNKLRSDRTSQPSISEAARHGRFEARPATFGAASLGRAKGLGKR